MNIVYTAICKPLAAKFVLH